MRTAPLFNCIEAPSFSLKISEKLGAESSIESMSVQPTLNAADNPVPDGKAA